MEPMASPTRSDLLQTIKEKKYRVSADYLLREIAGEYAIIPVGAACQISNAVMVPNDTAVFLWNAFLQPHTISLHRRQKSMRLRRKKFKIPY